MSSIGKKGELRYAALIGDIVASRSVPDRAALQERLHGALESLNRDTPGEHLAAPIAFTAGDEFQALLHQPQAAVEIIRRLADDLYPVRFHFGLGFGALTTKLRQEVGTLDGPCFHAARAAIERGGPQDRWVSVEGFGDAPSRAAEAIFRLIDAIRSGWTEKQTRHARHARELPQKEIAALLDVSPSVVSESLKAARFEAVREGEEAVRLLLLPFGRKADAEAGSARKANPRRRQSGGN